jgi:hypothetical protein
MKSQKLYNEKQLEKLKNLTQTKIPLFYMCHLKLKFKMLTWVEPSGILLKKFKIKNAIKKYFKQKFEK